MSASTTQKRILLGGARWLVRLALLALASGVAAAIVVVVVIPRMTQGAAMTVLTGSMTPEIPVGSVVLVRPADPRTLEVGDVATYQVEPGKDVYITHRITEVHDDAKGLSFTFKGDANDAADLERIPSDAVRGEVWFHVPYLGAIRDGLHGEGGITLVVMILLGGYAVSQLSGGLRDRRRADGAEPRAVALGRPAALAQLRLPPGESAAALARRWGALLLEEDETSATLLIVPPDDGMVAALELLASQDPVRVEVWDADSVLTGTARPVPQPQPDGTEADHVSG